MFKVRDFLPCLTFGDRVFISVNFKRMGDDDIGFLYSSFTELDDCYLDAVVDEIRFNGFFVRIRVVELVHD